jgi:hypothetical protein
MSPMFAKVIIHLNVGAQKKIVKGPAGCARNDLKGAGQGIFKTAAWKAGTMFIYNLIIAC